MIFTDMTKNELKKYENYPFCHKYFGIGVASFIYQKPCSLSKQDKVAEQSTNEQKTTLWYHLKHQRQKLQKVWENEAIQGGINWAI